MGSGTTAVAAILSNRKFVGYEIEEEYVRLAEKRIKETIDKLKQKKITEMIR